MLLQERLLMKFFLTYDQKGNLVRNESFLLEYFTTYTYTNNGSLESWKIFTTGLPLVMGEYTYEKNRKKPISVTQWG